MRYGVVFFLMFAGCSSRNIYPNVHPAPDGLPHGQKEIIRRQWSYAVDPISSSQGEGLMEYISPVLDDKILLFGSSRFGLTALYPNLGKERWRIKTSNGVVSPINVTDHTAYYTNGEGNLVSLALETGKPNWTYALRNPVTSRPTVDGKNLFLVTSDDALISIESQTGKWQWHYRRKNAAGPTIHGAAAPVVVGDAVWAGFSDGALVALTRKEGKVMWEKQLNNNKRFADLNADLVLSGDHVLVSAYDNSLYSIDAKTGVTLWSQENLGGSRAVVVGDGIVYSASSVGYVYAIEEKSGKVLWKFELDQPVASGLTLLEHHLAVASSAQYFYLLDKSSGKLVDRLDIGFGSGFAGPFAYDASQHELYGVSRGGNLHALKYQP